MKNEIKMIDAVSDDGEKVAKAILYAIENGMYRNKYMSTKIRFYREMSKAFFKNSKKFRHIQYAKAVSKMEKPLN